MALRRPTHGGNLAWAAQIAACSPHDLLDFSASINPLGPPPAAIASIQTHLGDLKAYPDPEYRQLRQALGQFHDIPAEWILPGNGSAELLTWASWELSELPVTYLLTPAFSDYRRALKAVDAVIRPIPLLLNLPTKPPAAPIAAPESFEALVNRWHDQAQASGTPLQQCGLLLNNPHNPTGLLFSKSDILNHLQDFALVVIDEAFMDFLPPDQQQSLIDQVPHHPQLVILRSLTKFYSLPGLRMGYGIAHPNRLQRWQQWRDPWSVNALAAAATEAVLTDTHFQQTTWNWLQSARSHLFQGLAALPGLTPFPGAANFLLVQSETSVIEVQQQLLERDRILIRDCLSFPELGDRYFRVAVRTEAENQRLLNGLAQILAAQPYSQSKNYGG